MSSRVLVLAGVCAVLLAPHPRISHAAQSAVGAISEELLAPLRYREIGPTRQDGRVVAIATSRQNPKRFFVGAGPGGMWRTVNEGHTFEPIFDHENTTSIGHVAVAPSDDSIVWVGTGEANLRNSTYYGDGVYKSADGGSSWTNMGACRDSADWQGDHPSGQPGHRLRRRTGAVLHRQPRTWRVQDQRRRSQLDPVAGGDG